jgi:hypothetical protein
MGGARSGPQARRRVSTGSIGVVTPFKGQRLLLERLLRDVVSRERVLVGTVHTFQGKERDVVIVSPVAAPGIHDPYTGLAPARGEPLERRDHEATRTPHRRRRP